jgi:hypothetical protein
MLQIFFTLIKNKQIETKLVAKLTILAFAEEYKNSKAFKAINATTKKTASSRPDKTIIQPDHKTDNQRID